MKKSIQIFTIIAASFLTFAIFVSYSNKNEGEAKSYATTSLEERDIPQVVENMELKKEYSFAGEPLPMDNFDVYERLERELVVNTYWHSSTLLNIKASTRFFPLFEKILNEEGVPLDFKYLAVAESNLRNVKSSAGACGVWQFMKANGAHYNMDINNDIDERYHIEKATRAACSLLKDLKKRFGTWTMAAGAYNFGSTRIAKEIKSQRAESYFDLNLNEETSRYIFRIIAIREVMENPQDFGFYLEKKDYYKPLDDCEIVEVNNSIPNLGDFAIKNGTTYRMLKVYNPWLRTGKFANPNGKTYKIKIPK
jgi:hypothetical protein